MGRFDGHSDDSGQPEARGETHPLLPGRGRTTLPQTRAAPEGGRLRGSSPAEREEIYRQRAEEQEQSRFAILLDATGSMAPLIDMARGCIGDILERMRAETGSRCLVAVGVYRDYDVPNALFAISEPSDDPSQLRDWLAQQDAFAGGDFREAIEHALSALLDQGDWLAVLLAGDAPPHTREELMAANRSSTRTAFELADVLREKGILLHTFVVGRNPETAKEFQDLAQRGGGCSGFLDGTDTMRDLAVMSMLARLRGEAAVKQYRKKYRGTLTKEAERFGMLLLEQKK